MSKSQDQKVKLGLSIVSVLVVTVFLNEWIVKSQQGAESASSGGRVIASFEDFNSIEGMKWEQELAQQLSEEKNVVRSLLAQKPTLRDELVFGFLEGKYKTQLAENKIQGFEFAQAHTGDLPLVIKEKEQFLQIFKNVFSVTYAKVQLSRKDTGKEVYKLVGSNNKSVGEALFDLDAEGRVLSLKISQ